MQFVLKAWSAWKPGRYWHQQFSPEAEPAIRMREETNEPPGKVGKTLQRRLSPLAKAVFKTLELCHGSEAGVPMVFSSSHGEVNRSLQMLNDLQHGEELSPTAFSLSVHNAIAGLVSIVYQNHHEINVLAPGRDGIAPAFLDALGMLQEQPQDKKQSAPEVIIVFYDEPLAAFYPALPYSLNAQSSSVLIIRMALAGAGLPMILERSSVAHEDGEQALQMAAFMDFLQHPQPSLQLGNRRQSWIWRKN